MINSNKLSSMSNIIDSMDANVKRIKKEKGLIERSETDKVILAEDNRQVLLG